MPLAVARAASDALYLIAYAGIPAILGYLLRRRRDFPFRRPMAGLAFLLAGRGACRLSDLLWPHSAVWPKTLLDLGVGLMAAVFAFLLLRELPTLLTYPTPETVRRTHDALDATLRKVTELERQKIEAQFMANVSHDLRTPITAIRGYSETLLKGGLDDEKNRVEFVRIIRRNAERIGSLVENLLALTTVDAAQTQRLAADVALAPFVAEVLEDLGPAARRRRMALVNDVRQGLAVRAQDQQLWQILQNLIGNAIKFTPRDGCIRVSARVAGPAVEISVADTGPGIDPAQLPLLFDRFHSRRQGKPIERGSGLGLSIVKALVEAHGGEVRVDSHPGHGSTFRFTLPAGGTFGAKSAGPITGAGVGLSPVPSRERA